MPFWVFALVAAGGILLFQVVKRLPGAQLGSGISLDRVQNDQNVRLSDIHGPTHLGISMPDPGHVILWTLTVDGQSMYANGYDQGSYGFGGANNVWTGTDLWVPLQNQAGTVIVDLAWPSSMGTLVLQLLGPDMILGVESAQTLDAQGLLHKTRYTITYGS